MAENKKDINDVVGFYLPLFCILYVFCIPICGAIVAEYAKDETKKWLITLVLAIIVSILFIFAIICWERIRREKIKGLNAQIEQKKLPEFFKNKLKDLINEDNLYMAQNVLDFAVSLQKKLPEVIRNGIEKAINEGNLQKAQDILDFAPTFKDLPDDTPAAIRNEIEELIERGNLQKAQDILNFSKSLLEKLPAGSPEVIRNKIVELIVDGSWQEAAHLSGFVFFIYNFICETCENAAPNVLKIFYSAICTDEVFAVFENMYSEEDKFRTFCRLYCAILPHIVTLITKEKQKIMQDDYGNVIEDAWNAEISYFLKTMCGYDTPNAEDIRNFKVIYNAVKHTKIDGYEILEVCQPTSIKVESGADYEDAVKILLENAGYEVRKTPVTGDQGVDLIVTHNDKKCAIQCKFYSGSVGNKAVQEVIAGRDFYDCDFGIVCSNSSYTKSARQLAHSQSISLTSHNEIAGVIDKLVG